MDIQSAVRAAWQKHLLQWYKDYNLYAGANAPNQANKYRPTGTTSYWLHLETRGKELMRQGDNSNWWLTPDTRQSFVDRVHECAIARANTAHQ